MLQRTWLSKIGSAKGCLAKRNCNKIKKEKMKIGTKLVKKRKLFKKKIDVELSCHLSIDVATKILPHQYII